MRSHMLANVQANANFVVSCLDSHCTGDASCNIPSDTSVGDLANWARATPAFIPSGDAFWSMLQTVSTSAQNSDLHRTDDQAKLLQL